MVKVCIDTNAHKNNQIIAFSVQGVSLKGYVYESINRTEQNVTYIVQEGSKVLSTL